MNKRLIILTLIVLLLTSFYFLPADKRPKNSVSKNDKRKMIVKLDSQEVAHQISEPKQIEIKSVSLEKIQKNLFLAEEPLSIPYEGSETFLSIEGVLRWSNKHRDDHDAAPLRLNKELNKVAYAKMEDLFSKNYFAHVSPDGIGPKELIEQFNYPYLLVGENLAKGNFRTDERLVKAWMDSPGHRENILKNSFQEIGIAVGQTLDNGRSVWIAVQTFGTPHSACPSPNPPEHLISEREYLERESVELEDLKLDIEESGVPDWIEEYNERALDFNSRRETFNRLVEEHNISIQTAMNCLEELGQ